MSPKLSTMYSSEGETLYGSQGVQDRSCLWCWSHAWPLYCEENSDIIQYQNDSMYLILNTINVYINALRYVSGPCTASNRCGMLAGNNARRWNCVTPSRYREIIWIFSVSEYIVIYDRLCSVSFHIDPEPIDRFYSYTSLRLLCTAGERLMDETLIDALDMKIVSIPRFKW